MRCTTLAILLLAATTFGQTTQPAAAPTTAPAPQPTADQLLNQMLAPTGNDAAAVLQPLAPAASSASADASDAGTGILREGTDIIDRMGRLQKSADNQQEEFILESDGHEMQEAPLMILPNLKLMSMETATSQTSHDLRFRITGTVTEYHGRNYILLEKVVVVPDKDQEF
jgi:hypothetical protein